MQRLLFRKVPKQSVDRSNVVVVAIGTSVCTKLKQTQIRCSENTIPHTKSGCGNRPASVKVQIDKKTRKPPSSTPPLPNATPMSLGPTQSLRVRSHSQNAMTNTRHQLEKEGKKKITSKPGPSYPSYQILVYCSTNTQQVYNTHSPKKKQRWKSILGYLPWSKILHKNDRHNDAKYKFDEFNQKSQTNDGHGKVWNPAKLKKKKKNIV